MRTVLLSFAIAFLFNFSCYSQSITPFIIHSTGGSYQNSILNFYADWNVGEMVLSKAMQHGSGNNLIVITNGLLQPEKLPNIQLRTDAVKPDVLTITDVKVFPNPTTDNIRVDFVMEEDQNIELTLYNSLGQQVYSKQISVNTKTRSEEIPMHNLVQGSYLLCVRMNSPDKTRQGTFKIVKTN